MDKMVDCFSIHFFQSECQKMPLISVDDMQLSDIALGNGDRLSFLRVNKNNGLNFDYHVTHLWKKAR